MLDQCNTPLHALTWSCSTGFPSFMIAMKLIPGKVTTALLRQEVTTLLLGGCKEWSLEEAASKKA